MEGRDCWETAAEDGEGMQETHDGEEHSERRGEMGRAVLSAKHVDLRL
jgi:hypothetical protein